MNQEEGFDLHVKALIAWHAEPGYALTQISKEYRRSSYKSKSLRVSS
jgi:hypothetical protein